MFIAAPYLVVASICTNLFDQGGAGLNSFTRIGVCLDGAEVHEHQTALLNLADTTNLGLWEDCDILHEPRCQCTEQELAMLNGAAGGPILVAENGPQFGLRSVTAKIMSYEQHRQQSV